MQTPPPVAPKIAPVAVAARAAAARRGSRFIPRQKQQQLSLIHI